MFHRIRRLTLLLALLAAALSLPAATPVMAQEASCANYSTAAAAQFALDINPGLAGALDPDGNGIACDHEGAGGEAPSSSDVQLPPSTGQTPTPASAAPPATVDVVDQQPAESTTTQTGTNALVGRLSDTQVSFETVHGAPTDEQVSESNPSITGRSYPPPPTAFDVFVIYWEDQVSIVFISALESWDGTETAGMIDDYLPTDVTTLPTPETLNDGSLLMTVFSQQLSTGVTAETMSAAGLPGVPGDLYVLLVTDEANRVIEVEMGIGNGDNVREDVNGTGAGTTTTTTPTPATTLQPSPTPVTTTTTDATTFLQQTRTEVDELQGQIDELRTILGAGTFTDAETQRLSEIIVSWLAIDTTLPTAPPEHSGIATELQQVRTDLSSVGLTLFTVLGSGDTSGIQGAADLLTTIETNLGSLDQQLTALGI